MAWAPSADGGRTSQPTRYLSQCQGRRTAH